MTRVRFREGSSGRISGVITDIDGNPVEVDQLTSATLTLYDIQTRTIINGRDHQDINAAGLSPSVLNNVSYEAGGIFHFDLQPEVEDVSPEVLGDNRLVVRRRQIERHQPEFYFEYPGGAFFYGPLDIEIEVTRAVRRATT